MSLVIPLFAFGTVEAGIALLLLSPVSIARPAIALCRVSSSPAGKSILGTLSVVLIALLASPVFEIIQIQRQKGGDKNSVDRRDSEAAAYLSAALNALCLLLIFVLRKLGTVISERERLKASEQAMLRQVKGLQDHYTIMSSSEKDAKASASGAQAGEVDALQRALKKSKDEQQILEARVEAAEKARRTAENNAEALKSQAKGLENEYDRLLGENDNLKKRLSRVDSTFADGSFPANKKNT